MRDILPFTTEMLQASDAKYDPDAAKTAIVELLKVIYLQGLSFIYSILLPLLTPRLSLGLPSSSGSPQVRPMRAQLLRSRGLWVLTLMTG